MHHDNRPQDFTVSATLPYSSKPEEFRCNHLHLMVGDTCVVDTDRGPNFAVVTRSRMKAQGKKCCKRLRNVIRKATKRDIESNMRLRERETELYHMVRAKVEENELKMKVSKVSVPLDEKRVVVYFTAEERVDFRDIVKSLSSELKMKIEMRQMGIRDEAKMLGGSGICGQKLCCSSFLGEFAPVSIRMAKDQNLSLNPAKISGVCGRLMCCLIYENAFYKEMQKIVPRTGKAVTTPQGKGKVVVADFLKARVTVDLGENGVASFEASEVELVNKPQPQKQSKKGKRAADKTKDGPNKKNETSGQAVSEKRKDEKT